MKNNLKIITLFTIINFLTFKINAQQTPVFANYNYNTVIINPAHAGYYPTTDITLTNTGFLGPVDGSPRNIAIVCNTNVADNMGLAIGATSDQIGVTTTSNVFASYSYKILFDSENKEGKWWADTANSLSFGLTAGAMVYDDNLLDLGIKNDAKFSENIHSILPTIGVGALYDSNNFYFGLSAPNLISSKNITDKNINLKNIYYSYLGHRFYTSQSGNLMINPSVLLKQTTGAPLQLDFNVMTNYRNQFEAGIGYRTSAEMNFLVGFHFLQQWRVLYSYSQSSNNSLQLNEHGVILTYRFGKGFAE